MTDTRALLGQLRRPRLLIRAARAGVGGYSRETHLTPLAPTADPGSDPVGVIERLKGMEAACEAARRGRAAGYSPGWHVQILVALLAEAERLAAGAA